MHVSLSPCVGICRLDQATGYCLGCGRTGDEIAAWSTAGPGGRRAIWAALPARLQSLGVAVRRLPWTAAEVRGFVIRSLREGTGAWRLAAAGAAAAFPPAGMPSQLRSQGELIEATAGEAALRLRCGSDVWAFAIEDGAGNAAAERVVLAVQTKRPQPVTRPPAAGGAPHADHAAVHPASRLLPLRVVDADEQGTWWGIRRTSEAAMSAGSSAVAQAAVAPAIADPTSVAAASNAGASDAAPVAASAKADAVVIETALGRIEVPVALARLDAGATPGPDLPRDFIIAATFEPRL